MQPASPDDTQALRTLIIQLTNYYNSANSAGQLREQADQLLDGNIRTFRADAPGDSNIIGKKKYFDFVEYDFGRWTAHTMGTVEDVDGGPVNFCVFNFDLNTLSANVKYPFSFTPKNGSPQTVNITATWNFTRAQGKNQYNWVMNFANIQYY
jgi:hypothetical protein